MLVRILRLAALLAVAGWSGALAQRPAYHPDRITAVEIQTLDGAKTAYDAIRALRPQFLQPRPSGSIRNSAPVPVKVFVDGLPRGGTGVLREIQANSVADITWLSGNDATTRFGTGHESGAILITSGRLLRPPP